MEEKIQNSSLYGRFGKKERFFIMLRKTGNPEFFVSPVDGYRLDDPDWPCFVCYIPYSGWEICELKTGLMVSVYYYDTRKEAVKDFPRCVALLRKHSENQHFIAGYNRNVELFEIAMNTYRKMEEMSNGETT